MSFSAFELIYLLSEIGQAYCHYNIVKLKKEWSCLWKDLLKNRNFVAIGININEGDGGSICFWHDRWRIQTRKLVEFSKLYKHYTTIELRLNNIYM